MKVLVIPTATLVSPEIQLKFGSIPSVMTPLQDEPILKRIYKKYSTSFDKILLVGKEKKELIEDYISISDFPKLTLLELDHLKDLGYSVLFGLNYIKREIGYENVKQIAVNLGDTFIEDIDFSTVDNCLVYSFTVESKRWTTFQFNGGKILSIADKNKIEDEALFYGSFVGVFSFCKPEMLHQSLALAHSQPQESIDSFYQAILLYNEKYDFNFLKTNKWIDVGHIDNYENSNRTVKERYFNSIKIDRKRGVLEKRSTEIEKFRNEIVWYLKLPKKVQYISPRILDYSIDFQEPFVQMEYYGYANLNEIFVYGDHSLGQWTNIFESIFFVVDEMSSYSVQLAEADYRRNIEQIYVRKTLDRLKKLREQEVFHLFFTNTISVNDVQYHSLEYYMEKIENEILDLLVDPSFSFSIIHGDLCFSNILFDTNSEIIRVIDPRGSFGDYDIYGDSNYDLAKLYHSIDGKYDFIINDLTNVEVAECSLDIQIHCNKKHNEIRNLFKKQLTERGKSLFQIELIESLLFFSMIPLHKDHVRRQYAMLGTAVQLFENALANK